MRPALLAAATLIAATPVQADTVCEWMDFVRSTEEAASPPADSAAKPDHAHARSQAALAMFEALNAIDHRYQSYLRLRPGDARASQQAAAITAAYKVLAFHFPSQKQVLEDSYALAMDEITDARARDAGREIGEKAAKLALKAGNIDPRTAQHPYRPRATSGVWVPTALPLTEPFYVAFRPWFMDRADSVRPGPPPPLTSERYARDLQEVQRLGRVDSRARTAHQTLMAKYRITPDMMPALRTEADQNGRRLVDNARLFALFEMISNDGSIAMSDAKLHYNFWRPITAIRNADQDGNPATSPDASWIPLIRTPNHPEYPCAHCIYAGAWGELMKSVEGDAPPWGVRVATRSVPNAAIQVLPSWDRWVAEVNLSRTLGGVHYRFSNEAGEAMGRKITRIALAKAMRPLPPAEVRPAAGQ